ncbi:FAD:protein FMN transferase [Marinimicrobium alkaliphilum]|uniref:FAD:protein FMN transferase n=1 Tax=Marinimicrobium alkaliphilum TaxID=2202654 RepID=UPI000DBA9230|nr:FAD:protein FMN transferase [Marinimicrobium alkaliphilum]
MPQRLGPLLLLVLSLSVQAEWHSGQWDIMGTRIDANLWQPDPTLAREALAAVAAEMHWVDHQFSPYRDDSQLSRLNREASRASVDAPLNISPELSELLARAAHYSELTDGAFDITFASVGRLYDYRAGERPDPDTLAALRDAIDYRLIRLDVERHEVYYADARVYADLGGIAKGYAVQRAMDALRSLGIEHASVSAGGDSQVIGERHDRPWVVGIKNPRDPESIAIRLPLTDAAISTSGDYERYFIDADGERIHHILNPDTGTPAGDIASATVIGPSAYDTDPLSTAVFIMGVDAGLALINRLPDFDAVVITRSGQVFYSDGLMPPED